MRKIYFLSFAFILFGKFILLSQNNIDFYEKEFEYLIKTRKFANKGSFNNKFNFKYYVIPENEISNQYEQVFLSDNNKLFAYIKSNKIFLYYNKNNNLEGIYNTKGLKINALYISRSNKQLFAITNNKGVLIWEIGNPRKPVYLEFKKQPLFVQGNVSSSHFVLVFKKSIKVFSHQSPKKPEIEIKTKEKITSLCYTNMPNEIMAGTKDGYLLKLEISKGKIIKKAKVDNAQINSINYLTENNIIATTNPNGILMFFRDYSNKKLFESKIDSRGSINKIYLTFENAQNSTIVDFSQKIEKIDTSYAIELKTVSFDLLFDAITCLKQLDINNNYDKIDKLKHRLYTETKKYLDSLTNVIINVNDIELNIDVLLEDLNMVSTVDNYLKDLGEEELSVSVLRKLLLEVSLNKNPWITLSNEDSHIKAIYYYSEGLRTQNLNDLDSAAYYLKKSIEFNKNWYKPHLKLAELYYNIGDFKKSNLHLQNIDAANGQRILFEAKVFIEKGLFYKAEQKLLEYPENDSNQLLYNILLGDLAMSRHDFISAEKIYAEAFRNYHNSPLLNARLGNLYYRKYYEIQKDKEFYEKSCKHFNRCLRSKNKNPNITEYLLPFYIDFLDSDIKCNDYYFHERDLTALCVSILKNSPYSLSSINCLSQLRVLKQNKIDIDSFNFKDLKSSNQLQDAAMLFYNLGDYSSYIKYLKKATIVQPQRVSAYLELIGFFAEMKDSVAYAIVINKALKENPRSPVFYHQKAIFNMKYGLSYKELIDTSLIMDPHYLPGVVAKEHLQYIETKQPVKHKIFENCEYIDSMNNFILLRKNEKFGVINIFGEVIIPFNFKKITISENNVFVAIGEYIHWYSQNGELLGTEKGNFKELAIEYFIFERDGLYGLASYDNSLILPPIFDKVVILGRDFFKVEIDGLSGCFNTKAQPVIPVMYKAIKKVKVGERDLIRCELDTKYHYYSYSPEFLYEEEKK
jgi:hypothetical protein